MTSTNQQCSAVQFSFSLKYGRNQRKLPNFSIGIDFLGPDLTRSKNKAEKNLQVARFANLNKKVAFF